MASDMASRRLRRELQALMKHPMQNPRVYAVPNEKNILEWHYVMEGVADTPYEGGYYHGKLIFPKEYPLKPPSVLMLTPSGRFKPNRRLCLSMSDFHPESWNPMWSVSTILTGLYSFMVETAPTLGSIETTDAQKRQLAKSSLEFNVKDAEFCKLFPELVEVHRRAAAESTRRMKTSKAAAAAAAASAGSSEGGAMEGGGLRALPGMQEALFAAAGVVAFLSVLVALIRFV